MSRRREAASWRDPRLRSRCYSRALVELAAGYPGEYARAYAGWREEQPDRPRGFAQQRAYRDVRDAHRAEFDELYDAQKPAVFTAGARVNAMCA
jgi:hypothetical protein